MRPIERGESPSVFKKYSDARDPLINRIGDFCSYCENALHSEIDIEHVQPKSLVARLAKDWSNFLLACGYCNSTKGARRIVLADYLWPDTDCTFLAFEYRTDLPPSVAGGLPMPLRTIAQRTLELTGLDRVPGHPQYSPRDRRWIKRREVWGVALDALAKLKASDTQDVRLLILNLALSRGFFSVWMTVFQDHPDMLRLFIGNFPGTAPSCFDAEGKAKPRPGGKI